MQQAQGHDSFDSTPIAAGPASLFACDDPIMAQYLQDYPVLQPTRVMGSQPTTSRESMIYPGSPSGNKYFTNTDDPRNATGLGIQGTAQVVSPEDRSDAIAAAFASELNSPSYGRQGSFVGLPQQQQQQHRYNMLHGYGPPDSLLKCDPESLDMQARSGFDAVFPHQRTPSARRGPFKDHDQRERTAHTRKIGSCIRCRMQRIRVSCDH